MGLYDTINCKYKLPLPSDMKELLEESIRKALYQTKDLDESMGYFEIKEDGTLWEEKYEAEYINGDPNGASICDRLGYLKRTKEWLEPSNFTGEIFMYENFSKDEFQNDYWLEYRVTFIKGTVDKADIFQFTATDSKDRKHRELLWKKNRELEREFEKTLFYKCFYLFYIKGLRFLFNKIRQMSNWLSSSWKLERKLDFMGEYYARKSGVRAMQESFLQKNK